MGLKTILAALVILCLCGPAKARNVINGTISRDTTWTAKEAPYLLTGMIAVTEDAALHIQPWVTVRFMPGARLEVKGRLTGEKVCFDGWQDLANRETIIYRSGSTGYLRRCILENIELNIASSDVAVTRSLIANRNGSGVTVTRRAAPFIAHNDFRHNSYFAVYKAGRQSLNAPDNYWGAADGPGGSGPGQGDAVNVQVEYRPFATAENDDHVLLKHHRLDQRECRQGDRLNLEFTLFNHNTYAHDLILGASLYHPHRKPVHSTPDDLQVRVLPGRNVFKRPFRLPDRIPAGRYDIAWGVMKTDLSTYLVFRKEFDALKVIPAGNGSGNRPGGATAVANRGLTASDRQDELSSGMNEFY